MLVREQEDVKKQEVAHECNHIIHSCEISTREFFEVDRHVKVRSPSVQVQVQLEFARIPPQRDTLDCICAKTTMSTSQLINLDRFIQIASLVALFVSISWALSIRREKPSRRTVAILVLGDIGRSPRMMYHAECFAQHDFMTYLVGYGGMQHICDSK